MTENRTVGEIFVGIIDQILNGFFWTIGAVLALLLFAWLGYNPFK